MYIPSTKWSWSFLGVSLFQAVICLAFEIYVFITFQIDIHEGARQDIARTIPTFLALYSFGFIYQIILVYDALRLKNTIQVIGLVVLNIGLLIYGAVQLDTISDGVNTLKADKTIDLDMWSRTRPLTIAIPCILGVGTIALAFLAWKLYDEFAWTIYRHISADLRMKKRYLTYQIYMTLLKFDYFFFLGFTIQFVVIVRGRDNTEFGLTIAAIPVTIILLWLAAFFTRREKTWGTVGVLVFLVAGLGYFVFKLVRMYTPTFQDPYIPARKELTTFAVITIISIVLTIINAIMCAMNYNKGLKPYISSRKVESEEDKLSHGPVRPQVYTINSDGSHGYGGGYGGYGQNVEMMSEPYGKPGRVAPTRIEID